MFKHLSLWNIDGDLSKTLQEIPPQFLMTKQEMLDDLAMDFIEGELSWDEMYTEAQIVEDMFKDEG